MEVDDKVMKGEGFKQYYITKIEELQLIVSEKGQNLRRLQAQRNELNAKGDFYFYYIYISLSIYFINNKYYNYNRYLTILLLLCITCQMIRKLPGSQKFFYLFFSK